MSAASDGRTGAALGASRLVEETRERFVREIVARVPLERIVEIHFFPPIRQGGVETGVAVVAAMPAPPAELAAVEPAPEAAPEPAGKGGRGQRVVAKAAAAAATAVVEAPRAAAATEGAPPVGEVAEEPVGEVVGEPVDAGATGESTGESEATGEAEATGAVELEPGTAAADEARPESTVEAATGTELEPGSSDAASGPTDAAAGPVPVTDAGAAAGEEPAPPPEPDADAPLPTASMEEVLEEDVPVDVEAPPSPRLAWPRHTIFAASYRLTLKGPDRGRWDVDVIEEADAPLVTVEAVVRGVQRRAGDAADTERLSAADVAAMVARPPAAVAPTRAGTGR